MAHFRTGYQQHVLPLYATVGADLVIGDLVTVTAASGSTPAAIAKASTLAAATHMIALSDESVGGNYVPTDLKNYAPSNTVAKSTTAKKVGLYPLFDKADVIVD
jgi:N-acetylmuramic acid 6-phosphate (MurNAc-6-P) etherase